MGSFLSVNRGLRREPVIVPLRKGDVAAFSQRDNQFAQKSVPLLSWQPYWKLLCRLSTH